MSHKYTTEDVFYFLDILETVLKEGEFSPKFDIDLDIEKIDILEINGVKDLYAEMTLKRRIAHEIDLLLTDYKVKR